MGNKTSIYEVLETEEESKNKEIREEHRRKEIEYDREQKMVFNSIFDDEITILEDECIIINKEISDYRRNQVKNGYGGVIYNKDILKKMIINSENLKQKRILKEEYNNVFFYRFY